MADEQPYMPDVQDIDSGAETAMENAGGFEDLRDPWFHTEDGKLWLAEQADAAGAPGVAGF